MERKEIARIWRFAPFKANFQAAFGMIPAFADSDDASLRRSQFLPVWLAQMCMPVVGKPREMAFPSGRFRGYGMHIAAKGVCARFESLPDVIPFDRLRAVRLSGWSNAGGQPDRYRLG